jgi:glycosyltransferase involved in cell wall biosynthesis
MRVTGLAQAQGLAPERCREHEDLPQARLHEELPRRRVYIHPFRWTSLGLSLIEAMFLAMPVVALATTEAPRAVPPAAGAISTDLGELHAAMRRFAGDPAAAREAGLAAREAALARYGLKRFLRDWDQILQEVSA